MYTTSPMLKDIIFQVLTIASNLISILSEDRIFNNKKSQLAFENPD